MCIKMNSQSRGLSANGRLQGTGKGKEKARKPEIITQIISGKIPEKVQKP